MTTKLLPAFARAVSLCVLVALSSSFAHAQSQATTGNIEGRVLDPNGAAVPGVTVTATNRETGFEKSATSGDDGLYRIVLLPPGAYRVAASGAQGFQAVTLDNVQVTVGGRTTLDVNLTVSGTQTIIDVSAEAPPVETTRTSVSTTVNEVAIQNLPVSGRNYLDFATLTPGVVRDPTRTGDLSVGGQKGTLNNLQVDGVDNNNTFFGQAFGRTGVRPPYQFSEESVQEFQVNQNGFSAEFGRAGGAVINVVTKSGTNEFHGGAFEFFRDESLNANLPSTKAAQARRGAPNNQPPLNINQFGGRVGGPIVRNRAFFFATYDGQRRKVPNPLDVVNIFRASAAAQTALVPRLGTYPIDQNQDVYMGKVDWRVTNANQLSLRFNQQNFTGVNNESTGTLSAQEHSGNSLARTTTFSGTLASTLTTKVVNELRFQFARDKEPGLANSDQPETRVGDIVAGTTTSFLSLGRNNFSPRETTIKRAQFVDNVLYTTGRHNFKTGVDLNFDRILNFFPGFFGGSYTFNNYTDFANNVPSSFQQAFAGANTTGGTTNPNSSDYAAFAQDDWRVTPKLTLNVGVRYDYQKLERPPTRNPDPTLIAAGLDTSFGPSDKNNFAPRFGFSYAPDYKTVVRGGYGIFYGRTTGIMLGTAHSQNGINVINITLNATQLAALGLRYPNVLAAPPTGIAGVTPSLYLFARDYVQPYVQQARLGVEREVLPNTSLSITYLFYRGVHLSRTRDVNLPVAVQATALEPNGNAVTFTRFTGPRRIPTYNRINLFESNGNSRYDGVAAQLTRRFSRNFQLLASYTFSQAQDDKPDQTSVVPGNASDDSKIVFDQSNIRLDYGTADVDIPQRIVVSPVYDTGRFTRGDSAFLRALLSDWTLSSIAQFQTGVAYSATVGADLNNDGNRFNDRVPGTRRNAYRTRDFYSLDARLARSFRLGEAMRLRLIAEGFNLFNRANVTAANANLYSGFAAVTGATNVFRFTEPTAASAFALPRIFAPARELQLAVKFDF